MSDAEALLVDPARVLDLEDADPGETGIYVRAKQPDGSWCSIDIYALEKASLLAWLRSRGDNRWAEDVVGILLGHGHLHTVERVLADGEGHQP
jgi:hypothetical protein